LFTFLTEPVFYEQLGLHPIATPDWFPFPIRWYALAYITGLIGGWWLSRWLVARDALWDGRQRAKPIDYDDLVVWIALGTILGGRLAHIIFYEPARYAADPLAALRLWEGGMSFHGGLAGVMIAMVLFARKTNVPLLSLFDVAAVVAPIGLFLGRIANFINGELFGRTTDGTWGIIYAEGGDLPRHPSQLYEAGLEGLLLFAIVCTVALTGGLKRPGLLSGIFGVGYAAGRMTSEFFREPDAQLGFLFGGWLTMGMVLSLPVLLAGFGLMLRAKHHANAA
jgi:phosphatidylglycerol---prolipoprotein diacylglyceryl transferase